MLCFQLSNFYLLGNHYSQLGFALKPHWVKLKEQWLFRRKCVKFLSIFGFPVNQVPIGSPPALQKLAEAQLLLSKNSKKMRNTGLQNTIKKMRFAKNSSKLQRKKDTPEQGRIQFSYQIWSFDSTST